MTSSIEQRWRLRSPLPVLWRPDGALQLGLEPPAGLVLGGLPRAAGRVLEALYHPCGEERLRQLAGAASGDWLPPLIGTLQRAGLLSTVRPGTDRITLIGSGRLTLLIAQLLLASVTAPIRMVWPGSPVPPEAAGRLQRRHPGRVGLATHLDEVDAVAALSVIVARAPEPDRSLLRQVGDRPQLLVCGSDLGVSVGPLVVPGRTPCVRCEDLHRTDRDAAWPRLLVQLSRPRRARARPPHEHWAAGAAALHAAAWMAGEVPDSLGAALELDAAGALRVRPLRAHPGCGCGAAS